MKNLLVQLGYQCDVDSKVWSKPDYQSIRYSDGDAIESKIESIVAVSSDLSILSTELANKISDWPTLYHLGRNRANILRPFRERLQNAQVLEVGAGCGAITRYLGECGAQVLALEGSRQRARIARSRTRDLTNVEVLSEAFGDFQCDAKFDVITLIGVLEYSNLFTPGDDPVALMLQRISELLTEDGCLIIAIENQLGLKYFAGAAEDHLGIDMYGVEGRYARNEPETFGRKVLEQRIACSGFSSCDVYAPFPDYKLPTSIVTARGFDNPWFRGEAFACESVHKDPQRPAFTNFAQELVWPALWANGIALDLSNSLLLVAGKHNFSSVDRKVLAYHYSTERVEDFCKETIFSEGETASDIHVVRRGLWRGNRRNSTALLEFHLQDEEAYVAGRTMLAKLHSVVTRDGWTISELTAVIKESIQSAQKCLNIDEPRNLLATPQTVLDGELFDLTAQNILLDVTGRAHVIDREWKLKIPFTAGWFVFRTLLLLVQSMSRFGHPQKGVRLSRLELVREVFSALHWTSNDQDIAQFAKNEAHVQSAITGLSETHHQNWWADSSLPYDTRWAHALRLEEKVAALDDELDQAKANLERGNVGYEAQLEHLRAELTKTQSERDQAIHSHTTLHQTLRNVEENFNAIKNSKTWRWTYVAHSLPAKLANAPKQFSAVASAIEVGGGFWPTVKTTFDVLRKEGVSGIRWRLKNVDALKRQSGGANDDTSARVAMLPERDVASKVPYFIDPLSATRAFENEEHKALVAYIVVHDKEDLQRYLDKLDRFPIVIDVLVEWGGPSSGGEGLMHAVCDNRVNIRSVRGVSSDVGMLSAVRTALDGSADNINFLYLELSHTPERDYLDWILGEDHASIGAFSRVWSMLDSGNTSFISESKERALFEDLDRTTQIALENYVSLNKRLRKVFSFNTSAKRVQFYLTTGTGLSNVLDAAIESRGSAGAIAEAYLLPELLHFSRGRLLNLQNPALMEESIHYENQKDFSAGIHETTPKVLCYYLPQFHYTPENDEWHGKNFTEWTKVQAANPLFEGHYQQHIPHKDIGYYLLTSPDALARQAEQMRQAGVFGQVFYHYWFTGRMILEQPAKMLLAHPEIDMPFCFCWANENWTRRWDGNEKEILLGQEYSKNDAIQFIRYLIPFFKDKRYIKIDGRPVFSIYRPSSMPNPQEYFDIWEQECLAAGLHKPYLVATLTRGALDPRDFKMDAGVERVLHDWTDGAVPEMKDLLKPYSAINGSVLSYEKVASFYNAQKNTKPFTYFRSIVPIWDNTARYGSQALVVHGGTPKMFEDWFGGITEYTRTHLTVEQQFIFVNAWNEWAEGAHLEPDAQYGYAYLNAIGRVLTGESASPAKSLISQNGPMDVHIEFSDALLEKLGENTPQSAKFFNSLLKSSLFKQFNVSSNADLGNRGIAVRIVPITDAQTVKIRINRYCIFNVNLLEQLVRHCVLSNADVVPFTYGSNASPLGGTQTQVTSRTKQQSPIVTIHSSGEQQNAQLLADQWCFELGENKEAETNLPSVSTIVRFHKSGRFAELFNALSCLNAMRDCQVQVIVAAQDLSSEQTQQLRNLLDSFLWSSALAPRVMTFESEGHSGDLRSKMLNEALLSVKTQYAGFLDYDDLLFAGSYAWLISRMRRTGKAVAFGRVYSSVFNSTENRLIERKKSFEYGFSFKDFVACNHAPLHSFLIDVTAVDLSDLSYYDSQKYMEDYFLTLQVFTAENADWDSLVFNYYIGDYLHSVDREHTLALNDDDVRAQLLKQSDYIVCEERIQSLRIRYVG